MSVFWDSWDIINDKSPTLKEMQKNITTLEQERNNLSFKWETYLIWNESLWEIVKQDLSIGQKKILESLIKNYTSRISNLDNEITRNINNWNEIVSLQKQQLQVKQNFYISLLYYVQIEKIESFKKYVESELSLYEKSRYVDNEINQKNIKKVERVYQLEEKAEQNSEILRNQIEQKMTSQVRSKLSEFINQDEFESLPNHLKVMIFEKFVSKIDSKLSELSATENPTRIIEEKIFLFELFRNILREYIYDWE